MVEAAGVIRAFIALPIADAARQALEQVIARLGAAIPRGVRWVDPQGIHLTLKFLGDIDPVLTDPVLESLGRAREGVAPFPLYLSGLGMFPNQRQPRVLWAGVGGDLDHLARLQDQVESALAHLAVPRERRPFNPHLTLGRVRDGIAPAQRGRIGEALAAASLGPTDPWTAKAVHLVRSTLTPKGAVYTSLGQVDW